MSKTAREVIATVPGIPGGEIRDAPKGAQIVLGYMAADDVIRALGEAGYIIVKGRTASRARTDDHRRSP